MFVPLDCGIGAPSLPIARSSWTPSQPIKPVRGILLSSLCASLAMGEPPFVHPEGCFAVRISPPTTPTHQPYKTSCRPSATLTPQHRQHTPLEPPASSLSVTPRRGDAHAPRVVRKPHRSALALGVESRACFGRLPERPPGQSPLHGLPPRVAELSSVKTDYDPLIILHGLVKIILT